MIRITTCISTEGIENCSQAESGLSATHGTNGLTQLRRLLGAAGPTGSAEMRGADSFLRFTVRAVERLAGLSLVKEDRDGATTGTGLSPNCFAPPDPNVARPAGRPPRGVWRV